MTRKQFNSLPRKAAIELLSARALHNAKITLQTIQHCSLLGISHYRLSSSIFPLVSDSTLSLTFDNLTTFSEIKAVLQSAGDFAKANGVSCSAHPDQFNVLCSYTPHVVTNSINELNFQSSVLDLLGLPADYSAPMCLHLSCSPKFALEDLEDYRSRFFRALEQCDIGVQSRLVLENEDKGFWTAERLHNSFAEYIPLVYDNLHDACNPSSDNFPNPASYFRPTWLGFTPVFHWSEGIGNTNKHAEFVTYIPDCVKANLDCVWELELKGKDHAIVDIFSNFDK
jgi:UV DNA damage endonuclease